MLKKSVKFGTKLTIGPRLKAFAKLDIADQLLWEENHPNQEEPTNDGRGEFQRTREWIETATIEQVFDLWCRGQNLMGYAETLLDVTSTFRQVFDKKRKK